MLDDFVQLAATQTSQAFVAAWPHPFLIGQAQLQKPRTITPLTFESGRTVNAGELTLARSGQIGRLVLPVRKIHATFPSMITVGRTRNSDIVISDELVSKFHALFRLVDNHYELSDAGSQNGTHVGERLLVPKGAAVRVRSGDVIYFARLRFVFLDAAACWRALRAD
jgi:hypothetical protein